MIAPITEVQGRRTGMRALAGLCLLLCLSGAERERNCGGKRRGHLCQPSCAQSPRRKCAIPSSRISHAVDFVTELPAAAGARVDAEQRPARAITIGALHAELQALVPLDASFARHRSDG